MLENSPTAEKVKPTQEVMRADFESKEKKTIKEGTDFLENMEPEKFNKKAASWLLALSLFAGASTAFAGEQNTDKDNLPSMGEEQVLKMAEKNKTAGFDWGKIAEKIEVSLGAKNEEVKDFHPEIIAPFWEGEPNIGVSASQSEFYKGLTFQDILKAEKATSSSIYNSKSTADFFKNLSASEHGFSDRQKAFTLQVIGWYLGYTYNYDMLNSGTYVEVSGDKMFRALKDRYFFGNETKTKSGICGNIHTFLTKTAESLGIEAWLQSGATSRGGHIWSGMILESDAEKQIVFLDYWGLIPTGTLNYQDALGVAERYHEAASIFNSYVGNVDGVLFPVKSRAAEVVEKAAGIDGSAERLEANLEKGEIEKWERGLEIKMSPETTEIKLSSDTLAFAFTNFKDVHNNPYQSLDEMSAIRGSAIFGSERFGLEVGATVLHMSTKDLYGGTISANDIIAELAADYIDKKQLTKNEYGKFIAEFGATVEGAIRVPLKETEESSSDYLEGKGDATFGGRLVYVDPDNLRKVYVGVSDEYRGQINNMEDQNFRIKEVAKNFVVGGEVKVYKGSIVKMNIGTSDTDWGRSFNVGGGVVGEKLSGAVSYEKKSSDYERFIPSSEKIEVSVSYKNGPKWEVDVIGAKTMEKYKDAQSSDIYNAEVKLKIFLW